MGKKVKIESCCFYSCCCSCLAAHLSVCCSSPKNASHKHRQFTIKALSGDGKHGGLDKAETKKTKTSGK